MTQEDISTLRLSFKLITFRGGYFFWRTLGLSIFFVFPMITAYLIQQIFDSLVGRENTNLGVWTLVLLVPVAYLGRMILALGTGILEYMFMLSVQALLRENLMRGILHRPGAEALENTTAGEVLSRFKGDVLEISWFVSYLAYVFSYTVFFVIAFKSMFSIHSGGAIAITAPFFIIFIVIFVGRNRQKTYRRRARRAAGRVTEFLGETLGAVQSIKLNSAEDNVKGYFERINEERTTLTVTDRTFNETLRSFGTLVMSLSTGLLLFTVGEDMLAGRFTVGDFAYFTTLLAWMFSYVNVIAELISWHARVSVSFGRLSDLLDYEGRSDMIVEHRPIFGDVNGTWRERRRNEIEPLEKLEIRDLTLLGNGGDKRLDGVSFDVERGEFVVITGKVGSGKTSLLRCILGLVRPSSGRVLWNGQAIEDLGKFFIPPHSSYTPQVPTLFSETIEENLLMGLRRERHEIDRAVELAVLTEDIQRFDKGMKTVIGPRGVRLSGGQRHRVAAARMFLRDSELVVVDDLSSALDVKTERRMWQGLHGADSTFIVVSHHPGVLRRADRIVLLDGGRIVAMGRLDQLLEESPLMQEIWSKHQDVEE